MTSATSQHEFAMAVVKQLRDAGHEAVWAGGCVRDQLLGLEPKDYDVATSARPDQVRELFGRRRTLAIGAAFGVISVLGGRSRDPIEVATFRTDGAYDDGRHPIDVQFTTAEHDAQRRDFTINGMFYDPLADEVVDYVNGRADLRDKTIRAIGDPQARFAEDKLRMLRAVRFATTFGFEIEPATLAAIRAMAEELTVVSDERVGAEWRRILVDPERSRGVRLLQESGLLQQRMAELSAQADRSSPAWQRTLDRLQRLESDSLPVALAASLSEVADPPLVRKICRRFRFTNKEIARAAWLVEHLPQIDRAATMPWPRLQRLLVDDGATELIALADAAWGDEHPGVVHCRERLALPTDQLNPPPLVTGDDLVAHGLRPGPHFAGLLDRVRDAQLDGILSDPQQALAQIDRWLVDEFHGGT